MHLSISTKQSTQSCGHARTHPLTQSLTQLSPLNAPQAREALDAEREALEDEAQALVQFAARLQEQSVELVGSSKDMEGLRQVGHSAAWPGLQVPRGTLGLAGR